MSDQDFRLRLNETRMSRDHGPERRCHSDGRGHSDGQARPEVVDSPSLLIVDGGPSTDVVIRSVPDLMADRCHGDGRANPACGCRGYETGESMETEAEGAKAGKASPRMESSSSYIVSTMTDGKELSGEERETVPYFKADVCSSI